MQDTFGWVFTPLGCPHTLLGLTALPASEAGREHKHKELTTAALVRRTQLPVIPSPRAAPQGVNLAGQLQRHSNTFYSEGHDRAACCSKGNIY